MDFMREVGMEDASFIDADGGFISLGNMSSGYYYRDKKMELFSSKLLRLNSCHLILYSWAKIYQVKL